MNEKHLQPTAYDEVPYKSYPYPQSHPARLATIATLLGMKPAGLQDCRVLELGCCSGGNLLPAAQQFSGAQFVGLDASGRQVEQGQIAVRTLGLKNVRLLAQDILKVTPESGEFDYIVAHGVYSWVPPEVQEKMLSICRDNLARNGVAYISYNTYPGWRMRGIIRDIMLYRGRRYAEPGQRLAQARSLVDFLSKSVAKEDDPYGLLLSKELGLLQSKEDHYLQHEFLEESNEPVYFHEFAERAKAKGLQYLGEADFGSMSPRNLPPQVRAVLQAVADDVVELEQYMDLVRNRMFRQTLLCHADIPIDRSIPAEHLLGLYVASPLKPEGLPQNMESEKGKTVFRAGAGVTSTTDPLVRAALMYLGEIWPGSAPFTQLVAISRSRISGSTSVVDVAHAGADARRLAGTLLRCYETGQVELSVQPAQYTVQVAERPRTTPLARLQSAQGNLVTNLKHELVNLSDLERHVLQHLDGQHGADELLSKLLQQVEAGSLLVHEQGHRITGRERIAVYLKPAIETTLTELAKRCLFTD